MSQYPIRWVTDALAVGYAPRSADDLGDIRAQGIAAIVNLCAECYDLHDAETDYGFEVHYLPVHDEAAPDMDQLEKATLWIHDRIHAGQRVLVHCRYGIGRTGTLVLAYLLYAGHGFKDARRMMKKTPSWPATREQITVVDQFIAKLGQPGMDGSLLAQKPKPFGKFFDRWRAFSKWA